MSKVEVSEGPVSRFWACLFSGGIFGFIWMEKIKETKTLIIIQIVSQFLVMLPLMAISSFIDNPVIGSSDNGSLVVLLLIFPILILLPWIVAICYMFKWTTKYNLDNFGYKSKKEWKKANFTS